MADVSCGYDCLHIVSPAEFGGMGSQDHAGFEGGIEAGEATLSFRASEDEGRKPVLTFLIFRGTPRVPDHSERAGIQEDNEAHGKSL